MEEKWFLIIVTVIVAGWVAVVLFDGFGFASGAIASTDAGIL